MPHKYPQGIQSSTFLLGDTRWFIYVSPDHNGLVYLGIVNKYSPGAHRTSFSASVVKADGSVFRSVHCINVVGRGAGMGSEIFSFPRSELFTAKDVVLPDGTLTVLVSVCFLDQIDDNITVDAGSQTASSDGLQTLSQNFQDFFLDGAQSDITFKVQGRDFLAHKAVLSARSAVFHAMLNTDMIEKNEGIIEISDFDPDNFKHFLFYIYSGKLDVVSLSLNNTLSLYMLADKYNLKELKVLCCECLIKEISVDSFCDVALFAWFHEETKLIETVKEFFNKNASLILPTSKWMSLLGEYFILGNELLIQMVNKYKKYC